MGKHRSKGYPFITLAEAIEKAKQLYESERFNFVPSDVVLRNCWNLSPLGSTGRRTIAALGHYGLIEDQGTKEHRRVRLNGLARRIILDDRPNSKEREAALQEAALNPSLFREIWERLGPELPSDGTLTHELKMNHGFNPDFVGLFIETFRATVEFANLSESNFLSEEDNDITDDRREPDREDEPDSLDSERPKPIPSSNVPNRTDFDLPIYLSTGQATLRMPVPMTSDDFEQLKTALEASLEGMKAAFVRDE